MKTLVALNLLLALAVVLLLARDVVGPGLARAGADDRYPRSMECQPGPAGGGDVRSSSLSSPWQKPAGVAYRPVSGMTGPWSNHDDH